MEPLRFDKRFITEPQALVRTYLFVIDMKELWFKNHNLSIRSGIWTFGKFLGTLDKPCFGSKLRQFVYYIVVFSMTYPYLQNKVFFYLKYIFHGMV